ncbi:hypothetical protein BDW75DRAFT_109278 [Aspergillus navahoensis]
MAITNLAALLHIFGRVGLGVLISRQYSISRLEGAVFFYTTSVHVHGNTHGRSLTLTRLYQHLLSILHVGADQISEDSTCILDSFSFRSLS